MRVEDEEGRLSGVRSLLLSQEHHSRTERSIIRTFSTFGSGQGTLGREDGG